jgi:hypothetical protein
MALANAVQFRNTNPSIRGTRDGIVITHREPLEPLVSKKQNEFHLANKYFLNPGLHETFPWLSKIANNYETYNVRSFRIRYLPTVPTVTPGSVYGYMDLDPQDTEAISAKTVLSQKGAKSSPLYEEAVFDIMGSNLNKFRNRYTRYSAQNTVDLKTTDFGIFAIYIEGATEANLKFGNVVAEYVIELKTPQNKPESTLQSETLKASNVPPGDPLRGADTIGNQLVINSKDPDVDGSRLTFLETGYYTIIMGATGSAIALTSYIIAGTYASRSIVTGVANPATRGILNTFKLFISQPGQYLRIALGGAAVDSFMEIDRIPQLAYNEFIDTYTDETHFDGA